MFKSIDTIIELTKAGFKPLSEAKPRHFAAIGKFIVTVGTEIDAQLKSTLIMQIGSGEELVPRAVISDMQIGEVMGALRRIAESRTVGANFLKCLSKLYEEISALRRVRNIVAHQTCLVRGNKLAFHNAPIARTDAAIEVHVYTLIELEQVSQYAKRVGYRIHRQFKSFVPRRPFSPAKEALLGLIFHTMLVAAVNHAVNTKKLTKAKLEELKQLNAKSHTAMNAYTEVAKTIDQNFYELGSAATQSAVELMTALRLLDAPNDPALCEIPLRLKPPPRTRLRRSSRSRARLPPPSQA